MFLSEPIGGSSVNKQDKTKGTKHKERWILICPKCFSYRNDLVLTGYSLQKRKCLDCGFIGVTFIEVEATALKDFYKNMRDENTKVKPMEQV